MPNTETYARAKKIFLEASELPRGERTRFLRTQCGEDVNLERQVRRLLDHDARTGSFLEVPILAQNDPGFAPGARLGAFRIVRVLGEGGMGVVYEAHEDEPDRRVALKLIRPGFYSERLRTRFRYEIRVLGQLRHPGIAQIYEAGTLEHSGQPVPYFAMELVEGETLLGCAAGLEINARLALLAQICDAVHHAHQKGVIHRDLKPGNILVEAAPTSDSSADSRTALPLQIKILDFGVARALDTDVTNTAHTHAGQVVGTVPYMSPEQVTGDSDAIDVRSDVYSVGVIAFELLTGQLPFQLQGKSLATAARIINEQEPPRLGTLHRAFRGDVETIVAKALQKEPRARYQSTAELASDIRRHLRDEPIFARAPSALYQLRKFARRHRTLVVAAALVLLAMVGATAVSTWQARVALVARNFAEDQKKRADESTAAARRQGLRATLAAAAAAIESADPIGARRLLNGVDEPDRNWPWHYWNSRLEQSIATFRPAGRVAGAWFGANKDEVVIVTTDGVVSRGSMWSGEPPAVAELGNAPIALATATNDGHDIVAITGTTRTSLDVFSAESGSTIRHVADLQAPGTMLDVSRDGRSIAVALKRRTHSLPADEFWIYTSPETAGASTGARIRDAVNSAGFDLSPDGVFTVFAYDEVSIWNARTASFSTFTPSPRAMIHCAFSHDGSLLATGGEDKTVRMWDHQNQTLIGSMKGHSGDITAVAFDASGTLVASAGRDLTIRLWNARTGECLATYLGHTSIVRTLQFDAGGSRLLSIANDNTVRVWQRDHTETPNVLRGHTSFVYGVSFTPDGSRVVSGAWDQDVRTWDAAGGSLLSVFPAPHGFITALAVSPDGSSIVTGHKPAEWVACPVYLWNAEGRTSTLLGNGRGAVCDVVYSADGGKLWVASEHRGIDEYDLTKQPISKKRIGGREPRSLALSPDESLIAGGYLSKSIVLFSVESGAVVRELEGHRAWITGLAFHPTRPILASASMDGTARLWDIHTGECTAVLQGHWDHVYAVAFSPDGQFLATGSEDTSIVLWDLAPPGTSAEPQEATRLRGHDAYVYSLAFSPDGSRLASGSGDSTVRIWDTRPVSERWRSRNAPPAKN